jgi:predicted TIM-barrel enzyme
MSLADLEALRLRVADGYAVIGAGVGTALAAMAAAEAGVDLIGLYNSAPLRLAGLSSLAGLLPYANANAVVADLVPQVMRVARQTLVVAGPLASDPYHSMPRLIRQLADEGVAGIQNCPSVALFDGRFRETLEQTGLGFAREVELIRLARSLDMLTCAYALTTQEARQMAQAGADIVVAHMGLTQGGTHGTFTLDEAVEQTRALLEATHAENANALVVCHGGPIATADHAAYVLGRVPGLAGFFGASSFERLPMEEALRAAAHRFRAITLGHAHHREPGVQ